MMPSPPAALLCLALIASATLAQPRRPASPAGKSAIQVGGLHDERSGSVGGKWIEIRYGRPIKRGRDLFGPPDWVEFLNDGAEIWRAGANYTTQLDTEVPIEIAGTTVEPGEYTVFIDLSEGGWTFVLSTWPSQKVYDYENKKALFGAYYYTDDRDVLRTEMTLEELSYSHEQLNWQFLNVDEKGGRLAIFWDTKLAWIPFTLP